MIRNAALERVVIESMCFFTKLKLCLVKNPKNYCYKPETTKKITKENTNKSAQ